MKTFTKAAIVAAGIALVYQGAYATPANDLILGFNIAGGSTEYTANLGLLSGFGTLGDNLSSLISTASINSTITADGKSSPTGFGVGVVGGNNGVGTKDLYATALTGSGAPTTLLGTSQLTGAAAKSESLTPLGSVSSAGAASWTKVIASSSSDNGSIQTTDYVGTTGVNPMSDITGSSISLDLWQNTLSGTTINGWTDLGTLTMTFGTTDTLTFTPEQTAVPEPAAYGAIAGAGLLVLSLRRQFVSKNA